MFIGGDAGSTGSRMRSSSLSIEVSGHIGESLGYSVVQVSAGNVTGLVSAAEESHTRS